MTVADFLTLLAKHSDDDLLGPCLRDAVTPFVFETAAQSWTDFRAHVSDGLKVDTAGVAIVGSGRFGFSLRPGRNFQAFSDQSDVDVVVVSEELFDGLWHNLLNCAYPRDPLLGRLPEGWLDIRRKEVYTGWLSPLTVNLDSTIWGARSKPLSDFRLKWFNTFKAAAKHVQRRHEDVKGRLYRTWRHAEFYHADSLRALRRTLAKEEVTP